MGGVEVRPSRFQPRDPGTTCTATTIASILETICRLRLKISAGTVSGFAAKLWSTPLIRLRCCCRLSKSRNRPIRMLNLCLLLFQRYNFRPTLGVCLECCQLAEKHSVCCFACNWLHGILALHTAYVPNERFFWPLQRPV